MKNQKGFIQIPLLIVIIASVLVLGSASYVGIKQYKNFQSQKVEKIKQVQGWVDAQQKILESAQIESGKMESDELEMLRKEVEELKKQTKANQVNIQKSHSAPNVSQEISSVDIQPYIDTIGVLTCWDSNYNKQYGTGVLLWPGELMTNWHVVEDMDTCLFVNDKFINPKYEISGSTYRSGAYILDLLKIQRPSTNLDFVIVPFMRNERARENAYKIDGAPLDEYLEVDQLNYKVGTMYKCSEKAPMGTSVAILGYPASSINIEEFAPPESVTTGIIAGYQSTNSTNYLVSAKVDHGNSGGLALGKENGKICLLGMPTWVVTGQLESTGIVQNIRNLIN